MNSRWPVMLVVASTVYAQPHDIASRTLKFDVASVKPNKSGGKPESNFPLGVGSAYIPNGGFFSALNLSLDRYIFFAYRINGNQARYVMPQLPAWATTDRFDIQARAAGNPSKDDMRMMMRSLLADRFRLAAHEENREVSVLALVLAKAGKPGPNLKRHSEDIPCPAEGSSQLDKALSQRTADGLPLVCGNFVPLSPGVPGRIRIGARNVTISFVADSLSYDTDWGRPLVDRTGLGGNFDFVLEWSPERQGPTTVNGSSHADPSGPTLDEAMREQLGLKLVPGKGSIDVLIVDHLQKPTEN